MRWQADQMAHYLLARTPTCVTLVQTEVFLTKMCFPGLALLYLCLPTQVLPFQGV